MSEVRAWFDRYITAFNEPNFDVMIEYYAPDMLFEGRTGRREGRPAFIDYYRMLKGRVDEKMEVLSFVGTWTSILAEVRVNIRPYVDWPDFPTGPLEAGEHIQSVNLMYYDIVDKQFARVRAAPFSARKRL